jgi:hypothetical protein
MAAARHRNRVCRRKRNVPPVASRGSALFILSVCALLSGCFDFGGLKPKGNDASTSMEAGVEDAPPDAALCTAELFTPTGWSAEEAAAVKPCGPEIIFAADPKRYYTILTGETGGEPGKVLRLSDARGSLGIKMLGSVLEDEVYPEIEVRTVDIGGEEVAAIIGSKIVIEEGVTLRAAGDAEFIPTSRPLVFIATVSIEIRGTLDVGSDREFPGPGHASDASLDGAAPSEATLMAGAGGSHGSSGGSVGALEAGTPLPAQSLSLRRGGDGGNGRKPNPSAAWLAGGAGGGVVQLVALDSIVIGASAVLSTGGGEGFVASADSRTFPGGGGGAGGTVVIEAPSVQINGAVGAPGGGGGVQNCPALGVCFATAPERGLATRATGAKGGSRSVGGCAGGAGSDRAGLAGSVTTDPYLCGGGGGAGIVRIRTAPSGLVIDDGATFHPDDRAGDGKLVQVREDLQAAE